jgi:membrane protein
VTARPIAARAPRVFVLLVRRFTEHDLLSYASAVAFQVLFALVPLALAALALLGFLGLDELWTDEVRPEIADAVSDDVLAVIDPVADRVLTEQRGVWLTFGLVLALWQLASAVRAATGPLNRIYGVEEGRGLVGRILVSLAIAVALAPCLLLAVIAVGAGGHLVGLLDVGWLAGIGLAAVRWAAGVALLLVAVWLVLRFAPARSGAAGWVSLGSALVIAGWLGTSLLYGLYVREIASYGSLFGALASVIVLLTYLYLLALTFLAGAQLDAILRERAS